MTFDAMARAKHRFETQPQSPDGFETALIESLNALSEAYASATIAEPFVGCDCCTTPEYLEEIRSTPIMYIDDDTVFDIVYSLGRTYGQDGDIAHFVPRFCVDGFDHPAYDTTHSFSRMAGAGFEHWPPAQRDSVRDFLVAQLRSLLGRERNASYPLGRIEDLYECFSYLGHDGAFFETWERSQSITADKHFAFLIAHIAIDDKGTFKFRYTWADVEIDRLIAWLRSPRIHDRLERATLPNDVRERLSKIMQSILSP